MTIRALPSTRTLQPGLIAFAAHWTYSGGKRDLRLDLLRGFAALAMIVDHIGGEQSWMYWVTGGGKLWVSAAELFVLIAGLTMGIVYGAMAMKLGIGPTVSKALGRAWRMYLTTVALTFAFVGISIALGLPWAPDLTWTALPVWALQVVTLQRTFFLVDIPFMYTVLIALAAPVLWALSKGKTLPLLAASWVLWAIWQVTPGTVELPWHVIDNSMFHLAAWQLIFVHGVVLGYHRDALARMVRTSAFEVLVASGAVLAVVGAAWATEQHNGGLLHPGGFLLNQLYDKPNVPFGRLVMLAVSFTFLYSLFTVAWQPISGIIGPLLMRLGQHSLLGYGIHLFVVAGLAWALPTAGVTSATTVTLVQLLGVAIVWLAVTVVTWQPTRSTAEVASTMTMQREADVRAA